jgi:osomolarity two-component system sensor histidine kinase NIK1
MKILLVEDNPLNQKIVSFYLRKENHEVTIASSGEEAINLFVSGEYKIILMDLMLPGMNGIETTRKIRKIEAEFPGTEKSFIIALTANTLDNDREQCMQSGMDEYMAKPFEMYKLRHIIENYNF